MKRQSTRQYYLGQKRKHGKLVHPTKQALTWVPETFHARFQVSLTSFEYRLTFQSIFCKVKIHSAVCTF